MGLILENLNTLVTIASAAAVYFLIKKSAKKDISDLKKEVAQMKTDLKTEMAQMKTDLKTEMAQMKTDLKTEMAEIKQDVTEIKKSVESIDRRLTRLEAAFEERGRWESRLEHRPKVME